MLLESMLSATGNHYKNRGTSLLNSHSTVKQEYLATIIFGGFSNVALWRFPTLDDLRTGIFLFDDD